MLNNKWLKLVLDVDFLTLNYLILERNSLFLDHLRASSQKIVKDHQFDVLLSYFHQILDNGLFNITYLHTTCTVF